MVDLLKLEPAERFNQDVVAKYAEAIEAQQFNESLERKISNITTAILIFLPPLSMIGLLKLVTRCSGRDLFWFIDQLILYLFKRVVSTPKEQKVGEEKKLAHTEPSIVSHSDNAQGGSYENDLVYLSPERVLEQSKQREAARKREPIKYNVINRTGFFPEQEIEEETRSFAVHKFEEEFTKDYQILKEDRFHQWAKHFAKDVETGKMSQVQAIEQATKIMVLSKIIEKNPEPVVVSEKSNNEHQPSESTAEAGSEKDIVKAINPEEVEKYSEGLGSVYIPSRFKVFEADLNRVGLSQNVRLSEKELKSRGFSLEKAYYFNDRTPSREEVGFWLENGWKVAKFDGSLVLISERLLSVIAAKYPPKSAVETFFEGANHAIFTLELKVFDILRS